MKTVLIAYILGSSYFGVNYSVFENMQQCSAAATEFAESQKEDVKHIAYCTSEKEGKKSRDMVYNAAFTDILVLETTHSSFRK